MAAVPQQTASLFAAPDVTLKTGPVTPVRPAVAADSVYPFATTVSVQPANVATPATAAFVLPPVQVSWASFWFAVRVIGLTAVGTTLPPASTIWTAGCGARSAGVFV